MEFSCTSWRCGGIWRAKLSRFCTICLVRCASCRITRRSRRALSGSSGFSIKRSVNPRMAVRGLLTSWATPETNCPTAAIFSACMSLDRSMGVGDISHDYDDVADLAVFSADGAQIDGELAADTVAANQGQIKVIDLLAAGHSC